jgi:hypothetical protein
MRTVLTAASHTDAAIVRNLLEEHGIPSSLIEARGYGGAPYTEVWVVRDEDSDRAVELIRALHSEAEGQSWDCGKCNENNPSAFEICWKCSSPRQ